MPYRKIKPLYCHLCGKSIEPCEDYVIRVVRSEPYKYTLKTKEVFSTHQRTKAMYHMCHGCSEKAVKHLVLQPNLANLDKHNLYNSHHMAHE